MRAGRSPETRPKHAPLPIDAPTWAWVAEELHLSPQQARVVECLLRGWRDKEIAGAMGLDLSTVRTHFSRIFQRTDTRDRVELVLCVFKTTMRLRAGIPSSRPVMPEPASLNSMSTGPMTA